MTEEEQKARWWQLFRSRRLIEAIKNNKTKISGFLVLNFAFLLSLATAIPVFLILLVKLILNPPAGIPVVSSIGRAVLLTSLILLLLPLLKWWGQSKVFDWCLRPRAPQELPTFSTILLARSFGLLPVLFFVPLKVLLLPAEQVVNHVFFPPFSALVLTGLQKLLQFEAKAWVELFLLASKDVYIRSSFWISLVMWATTFFFTLRKLRQLTNLPFGFLLRRGFVAVLLWDAFCFGFLVMFQML